MEFESYDPGFGRMDEITNYTYEKKDFEFKFYYMVYEKPYDENLYRQFACDDLTYITKVVFRIYNPDIEP